MRLSASQGLIGGLLLCASFGACAALGGAPLSGADRHVAATLHLNPAFSAFAQAPGAVAAAQQFTVNVVTLESGTVVREFVANATNQVFAVVWSGPAMPNLKELLGASFDAFASAPVGASGVRWEGAAGRSYSADGLVVHTHGVPGHFSGFAYLPAAFPAGVTLRTLRQAQ